MLKKQDVAAIMPLAEMLSDRGVRLETCAGSPIGNLTMASSTINSGESEVEATLISVSQPYDTGRKDAEGQPIILPSEHGFVKKRAADCIAKGVLSVISSARNVVIPAINATHDYVVEGVDAGSQAKAIIPKVERYTYDPIYASALVEGIATQYNKVDLVGMPVLTLPDLSDEQLHALVNSGSQEVRDFIAREDQECPGHLQAIWQIWFQGRPVSASDDFVFLSRMLTTNNDTRVINAGTLGDTLDTRKGYDSIMVAFLLANALYDNPVEGVTWNMDLPKYNMAMSAFKAHFGKVITRVYNARLTAAENKQLIINMPVVANWQLGEQTDMILLNGDVYKWYLEQGGSVEAIIGNVFSQRTPSGRTILDLRPQFEAAYDKVVNAYAGLGVTNKHRLTMKLLTSHIFDHIRGIDDAFWATLHKGSTKQSIMQDVQYYLASGMPIGTTDALDKVIIYVYTCFVYGPLRVEEFINAINNYPDQTLAPKVIAAHVAMDLVIKSLMNDVYYNLRS
ncbi:hypothetical protein pEaSNUABM37_00173 [Erwinia phage pEa_SNUABM_37]|nr:hypothetical protein pEaSNUABM37_00173 [Erwinia phage pEa_SNUABM_37]QXO10643.1 hypothetical protein pEaSNUABM48_00173 [Erwinia phage pEa_SNUABM_48]